MPVTFDWPLKAAWGTPRRAATTASVVIVGLIAAAAAFPPLRDAAGYVVFVSPAVILIRTFPNETKQFISRVLSHASAFSRRAELETVRQDLEGTLSLGAARMALTAPQGSFPPLRIDYVRSGDEVARLANGTVVVGIAQHENRERNLVAAAWAYVRNGVLPDSRPYIDDDVATGVDFVLTRELLHPAGTDAIREFMRNLWSPSVVGNARLKDLCAKLDTLQDHQLLGPIVMSEFGELATSLGFRLPSSSIQEESAAFVEYLCRVSAKEPGADIGDDANFDGTAIKCTVIFVARPAVFAVDAPNAYRKAIDYRIRRAYHRIYLLGLGRSHDYVSDVAAPYASDRRISEIRPYVAIRRLRSGRSVRQAVVKMTVDVRYGVSIGRLPVVTVGGQPVRDERASRTG